MPLLEARGVPVLLPGAWLGSPSKLRVNLTATSSGLPARSSGLLSTASLATFDWKLAIGDVVLSEQELADLAAAKEPFVRVAGRWHALRRSDVEKALRFLERRRTGAGIVELVRAVSGLETEEAGLELGEVSLDAPLADLLQDGDHRFKPLPTPASMQFALFPFQERGHGWLRMLGDLGVGGILADDMGLGKTVQAIAMLASEREEVGPGVLGPTLVVCPMSVVKQWGAEVARFAPSLRVHSHHGSLRLAGAALAEAALAVGRRHHLVRHRHPRRRLPRRDPLGPAAARRGAGRQEPEHEAGARAPPAARTAAAGDDRHADREPPQRAVGADGHRQPRPARLAGVVRAGVRAADRDAQPRRRPRAAALDRAAVHPPPREGRARGRAGAAADHGQQGLLPADRRAGEPLPRDGRPLAAADRSARRPLRPPRRRARDAQPPEAGVQPPRDAGRDGTAARRPLGKAGAAAGAAGAGAGGRQGARLHAVPRLRPARAAPRGAARPQRRLLPRPPQRAPARSSARGVRLRGGADACS